MGSHILDLDYWKRLWEKWDLRGFIILSLFLQTFLILFAPFRKKTSISWIVLPLWSAYLLADWAANFAVGLISSSQNPKSGRNHYNHPNLNKNPDLLAFWAPFLLVHLGGPDTITAFALEDNELWLRHLLGLIFQTVAAIYVFFQSLPFNDLSIPTLLMLFAGLVKYSERTRALYLASLNCFRKSMLKDPDPGPNYAKLMDEYFSKKAANLPTRIEMIAEPDRATKEVNKVRSGELKQIEIVHHAHRYFEAFKGIIVDLIFSFHERNQSREFFLGRTAEDAFAVVEVELNFIYETLYTKASVVYTTFGYVLRVITSVSVIVSLSLFYTIDKKGFDPFDVGVTYTLLIGAISLDVIAFVMLLSSDRTLIAMKKLRENPLKTQVESNAGWAHACRFSRIVNRRWSESISAYNLIRYCLHPRQKVMEKVVDFLGVEIFLDSFKYVKRNPFPDQLRDHIFAELRSKSELADDLETTKEICSSRGDWVLRIEDCTDLLQYVNEVDYDQSLLLWHVATELLYNRHQNDLLVTEPNYRDFAKVLSDYMLYLLVMQPKLMSTVAGIGQIRFRDTCAEAKKFFRERRQQQHKKMEMDAMKCFRRWREKVNRERVEQEDACALIFSVNTEVTPVTVKGDRSKSVLFDGCVLAKELAKMGTEKMWKVMSKVWVELMCYAACHCRADAHAATLSRGGELITIVWLLMAHLGLGDRFQISEGHARAKLIVGK